MAQEPRTPSVDLVRAVADARGDLRVLDRSAVQAAVRRAAGYQGEFVLLNDADGVREEYHDPIQSPEVVEQVHGLTQIVLARLAAEPTHEPRPGVSPARAARVEGPAAIGDQPVVEASDRIDQLPGFGEIAWHDLWYGIAGHADVASAHIAAHPAIKEEPGVTFRATTEGEFTIRHSDPPYRQLSIPEAAATLGVGLAATSQMTRQLEPALRQAADVT